jgi:hypothetical protein
MSDSHMKALANTLRHFSLYELETGIANLKFFDTEDFVVTFYNNLLHIWYGGQLKTLSNPQLIQLVNHLCQ